MKTEAEVRAAMRHLQDAIAGPGEITPQIGAWMLATIDVLKWTLGEPAEFSRVIRECDYFDRQRAKSESPR